jgi:microcystin-dependent protein
MSQPFVGEIRMFGGNFAPAGWMFCQGQLLPISENETLFNLIGTTYGGDGESTFALPNLQSRVPIHAGTGSDGIAYQIAEMVGVETVTLNTNQIPVHSHPMLASTAIGSLSDPTNNLTSESPSIKIYSAQVPGAALDPNAVTPVGGSQPHDNLQPYLCISFIISLFGIFPTQ